MIRIVLFVVLVILACSCGDAELEPVPYTPKLVIDGSIEQGGLPRVILTTSRAYFSKVDSVTVRELVETKAKVVVSDGETSEVLTLKKDDNIFPPYVYEGNVIRGEIGKTYTLEVDLRGERYTASTTIPPPPMIEQFWYKPVPEKEGRGYIYGRFTDDGSVDNYYRVFTMRTGVDKRYIPVYLSAIGDQFFNGKSFTFSILRGPESFTNIDDDLYFYEGDTVRIKVCSIDAAHFDFWRTLERELYLVGNPFSSSGNEVLSNIDGGKALGVWGGYGASYYQIVARE